MGFPGIEPLVQSQAPSGLAKEMLGMMSDQAPKTLELKDLYAYTELGRRGEPDLLLAQAIVPWAISTTVAPAAGENTLCQVLAVQGQVVVVEGFRATGGASTVEFWLQSGSLAENPLLVQVRDTGFYASVPTPDFFPGSSLVRVEAGTAAGSYAGRIRIASGAADAAGSLVATLPVPVVLRFGQTAHALCAMAATQNVGLRFDVWGYVRRVTPK